MPSLEIVKRSTFTFRSDIAPIIHNSHKSGIIHATNAATDDANDANNDDSNNDSDKITPKSRREEHAFAWIDDRRHKNVKHVIGHLVEIGFDDSRMHFIPYSSFENWIHCYPHACPYMECTSNGTVQGIPYFPKDLNNNNNNSNTENVDELDTTKTMKMPAKKKQKPNNDNGPKLLTTSALTDAQRSRLHIEIYEYFAWLHSQLRIEEASVDGGGRNRVRRTGMNVPGMRTLMTKLESTFRDVGEFTKKKEEDEKMERLIRERKRSTSTTKDGEVVEGGEEGDNGDDDDDANKNDVNPNKGDTDGNNESNKTRSPLLPMLETSMREDLKRIVGEGRRRRHPSAIPNTIKDFEVMYEHLVAYKELKGTANVPGSYITPDRLLLGTWVAQLRKSKRELRKRGLECEPPSSSANDNPPEEEKKIVEFSVSRGWIGLTVQFPEDSTDEVAAAAAATTGGVIAAIAPECAFGDRIKVGDRLVTIDGAKVTRAEDLEEGKEKEVRVFGIELSRRLSNVHLSAERVARLESIGLLWDINKPTKKWEEQFANLKQYKEMHGRWPPKKEQWESIGNWCHIQRRAYVNKKKMFMEERFAKLDEIGFPWVRNAHAQPNVSWEDNFQRLVEFHRVNRHFKVPIPEGNPEEDAEVADALRFHKWVKWLHGGYRSRMAERPSKLSQDRIDQLLELGFEFEESTKHIVIPDIPFERRLEQLQSCQEELGTLRIDHRYQKMDQLGAWAEQISKRYNDWQQGNQEISSLEQFQFNQLIALGFEFNVGVQVRSRRSWDENFNAFLRYQIKHGHSNPPRTYKADMRMGHWVEVQRAEYRLLCEGKKSKQLTHERCKKLKSAGFLWKREKKGSTSTE